MLAPGGTLFGYPKGLFLLSFTELWERFSYYGMAALLVLFLTAPTAQHGFGWERADALKLYGFYTGVIFCAPLLGGWIANNFWGERRCLLIGGILLVLGHACLGGPALLPWLAEQFAPALSSRIHSGVTASFFIGLALIAAGTALLKPTVSSMVGRFFSADDPRREAAFALFFVGIYIGSVAATFVAGFLGERVAWHLGFTAAGIGMTVGLIAYLWKQSEYLGDIGKEVLRAERGVASALTREERDRIKLIVLQGMFTVAYAAAFFQKGGLLTLFAREHLDRTVQGWEIPSTWFLVISTATFIIVTPLLGRLWTRLARTRRNPSAVVKLAWGIGALGIGYVIIAVATVSEIDGTSWGWLVATYLCFGIGDALVWPTQIAMVSRLAPERRSALFVGGWYLTIGLGSWLTGYIGSLAYVLSMNAVFVALAVAMLLLGGLLWMWAPRLQRLAHGRQ